MRDFLMEGLAVWSMIAYRCPNTTVQLCSKDGSFVDELSGFGRDVFCRGSALNR